MRCRVSVFVLFLEKWRRKPFVVCNGGGKVLVFVYIMGEGVAVVVC